MLELRPICEHCAKSLPPDSTEAMICSFECTFCADCVQDILHNVCPNCGGGLEKRPIRPQAKLQKYPALPTPYHQPIDIEAFQTLLAQNQAIPPQAR